MMQATYVHGDIRAFNTVFEGSKGFLIDFDFGGKKVEQLFYPQGYNQLLPDGFRKGKGGMKIEAWHDWSALGWLIFLSISSRNQKPKMSNSFCICTWNARNIGRH